MSESRKKELSAQRKLREEARKALKEKMQAEAQSANPVNEEKAKESERLLKEWEQSMKDAIRVRNEMLKKIKEAYDKYAKRLKGIQKKLQDNSPGLDSEKQFKNYQQQLENFKKFNIKYQEFYESLKKLENTTKNPYFTSELVDIKKEVENHHALLQKEIHDLDHLLIKQGQRYQEAFKEQKALDLLQSDVNQFINSLKHYTGEEKERNETLNPKAILEQFDLILDKHPASSNREKHQEIKALIEKAKRMVSNIESLKQLRNKYLALERDEKASDQAITKLALYKNQLKELEDDCQEMAIYLTLKIEINQAILARLPEFQNKVKKNLEDKDGSIFPLHTVISWHASYQNESKTHFEYKNLTNFERNVKALDMPETNKEITRLIHKHLLKHENAFHIIAAINPPQFDATQLKKALILDVKGQKPIPITADLVLAMLYHIGNNPLLDLKAQKARAVEVIKLLVPHMEMSETITLGIELQKTQAEIKDRAKDNLLIPIRNFLCKEQGWRKNIWCTYGRTQSYHEIMSCIQNRIIRLNTYIPNDQKSDQHATKRQPPKKEATLVPADKYKNYHAVMTGRTTHLWSWTTLEGLFTPTRIPRTADGRLVNVKNYYRMLKLK